MSRRRGEDETRLASRLADELRGAPSGLHVVGPPGVAVPDGWPQPCKDVYTELDGASLYAETLELAAAAEVVADGDRWKFGRWDGDDLWFDRRGQVWRFDPGLEAAVLDGTGLDRWLAGAIDAVALLFDGEGEYFDAAFDEDGELAVETQERMARAQLRRDPKAPAPRWRLAQVLAGHDQVAAARDELEQVVAYAPAFPWAWLDLARLSESLGGLEGARDEAMAAAEAAAGGDFAGYFWAQAARLCARAGDEPGRVRAAAAAVKASPDLVRDHVTGARAQLVEGDLDSVRGLLDLARAVAPRDLEVLATAGELDKARALAALAPRVVAQADGDDDDEDDDDDDDDEDDGAPRLDS